MIIVIEGPSAAGKTSWLRTVNPETVISEAPVSKDSPDRNLDPLNAERYWAMKNAERWALAERIELAGRDVYCDTDPFKLHYIWGLWQIGAASRESWKAAAELHLDLVKQRRLGFADFVFVSIPGVVALRQRKEKDATRTRRHFDIHIRLAGPLQTWYEALESIEPGRVVWEFPANEDLTASVLKAGPRSSRYSVEQFKQLVQKVDAPSLS